MRGRHCKADSVVRDCHTDRGGGGGMTAAVALIFLPFSPLSVSPVRVFPVARRESLADPLKPYDPASLCNSPIFPDCFTRRSRCSDAFMHS
jgi:hypothetical protein